LILQIKKMLTISATLPVFPSRKNDGLVKSRHSGEPAQAGKHRGPENSQLFENSGFRVGFILSGVEGPE